MAFEHAINVKDENKCNEELVRDLKRLRESNADLEDTIRQYELLLNHGASGKIFDEVNSQRKINDSLKQELLRCHIEHERHMKELEVRVEALRLTNMSYRYELNKLRIVKLNLDKAREISHVGLWRLGFQGRGFEWSDEIYRILGLTPGDIEPTVETLTLFVHPDDMGMLKERLQIVLSGGTFQSVGFRIVRRDGTVRHVYVDAEQPLLNSDGKPLEQYGIMQDITDHKDSEEQLELMRYMIDRAIDEASLILPDGRFYYVNDAKCRSLGYTREEFMSLHVWDVNPEMSKGAWMSTLKTVKEKGFIKIEAMHRAKDGKTFPSEIWLTHIDFHGREYTCSFVRDVAKYKEAEKTLRESRYILSKAQQIAHVGNWAWNVQTGYIQWSEEGFRIFGYMPQEVTPSYQWLLSRIHPEDRDMVDRLSYDSVSRRKRSAFDYRIIRPDGSIRYLNSVVDRIVNDRSGNPEWVYGINQDITERKQAEEALRKREAFLRTVFDGIQEGICVLDTGLNILQVNSRMEKWFGNDIAGKKCYKVFYGQDGPCEACPSTKAMANKTMQTRLISDLWGWNEIYASPLTNEAGEVVGVIEHVRDVTEHRRADEALEKAKFESELYIDLMGHDINNMNQITMGFLELLHNILEQDGKLDASHMYLLDKAIVASKSSSGLIENVRKLQKEKMGLYEPKILNIDEILQEVVSRFSVIPGRDIEIRYSPSGGRNVKANDLLKDVFINLIGNAVKHSAGELMINIDTSSVVEAGTRYHLVAIEDDGPGIPDSLKKTLFDRLNLTNTRARGKGFGLCLIKMLVDDYQGKFWVEDRVPGDYTKGAKFLVMLPAVEK